MIKVSAGCIDCGYAEHAQALQFDHTDDNKHMNVSDMIRSDYGWDRIKAEIQKCEVRCANCHAIKTVERRHQAKQAARLYPTQDSLDRQSYDAERDFLEAVAYFAASTGLIHTAFSYSL